MYQTVWVFLFITVSFVGCNSIATAIAAGTLKKQQSGMLHVTGASTSLSKSEITALWSEEYCLIH